MKVLPPEALIRRSPAASAPPALSSPPPPASQRPPGPSSFAAVLGRLGKRIDEGERAINEASSGKNVHDPAALLTLQAQVYRYVEAVDLATKLVERATGAVKTTLQGQ